MNKNQLPKNYPEKVYAGLYGKIIGVRYGAPVESWTSKQISDVFGKVDGYLAEYNDFAADDDINGTLFTVRALGDYKCSENITPEQIGKTLLNYAPFEHGYFWWGGYGISTEHTAYTNLRNGIMPPRSGSIEQNGSEIAEQIGGQIFIDAWGLVAPCNPQLAARLAQKAACVMHGGNGVYGGMFIAACVSAAFEETDINKIIDIGLSVIPKECEYARVVNAVRDFYKEHKENNWKDAFQFLKENFGYDKYPGICHIIPNAGIIILSLLYGGGDFSKSLSIGVMCGWDTDCNVANIGTILGVRNGLNGIDYLKWRKPIHDLVVCSSVVGSLNISDVARWADYIADKGYRLAKQEPPQNFERAFNAKNLYLHFEYPDSTHSLRFYSKCKVEHMLVNSDEFSHSGNRSLKIIVKPSYPADKYDVYLKTYYMPSDFSDGRYEPSFSPILYPGQTITAYAMTSPTSECDASALLYVMDRDGKKYYSGSKISLKPGKWTKLSYTIETPYDICIVQAGITFLHTDAKSNCVLSAFLDDFEITGSPNYLVDFSKEKQEVWPGCHRENSQFSYLKGIWRLENDCLRGSCSDFGETYTGSADWQDYEMDCTIVPKLGSYHNVNFRVQGAVRSYAAGLAPDEKLVLYKNDNGYRPLELVDFQWVSGKEYHFHIKVYGDCIEINCNGKQILYRDTDHPYLSGCVGMSVQKASCSLYKNLKVRGLHKNQ